MAAPAPTEPKVLATEQVQAWYDHFGRKQDTQDFYAGPALADLIAHADFRHAQSVFEFGCGTGHFAARLLTDELPASATYTGYDLSPVMVGLATQRVAAAGSRARVLGSDGRIQFPSGDHATDRVVSNYVLDLLSADDTRQFFGEARRVLVPGGLLCLVSLTEGISVWSRMVCAIWSRLFRWRPTLVGGCRPIRLRTHVAPELWRTRYHNVISAYGVPSEVLVLESIAPE